MSFRLAPLRGAAARNKGMALFPRKIGGKYAMIARQDNENLYLIYSDDLYTWDGGQAILKPQFPWEFVQIGNCGSPIELDEGWLLLTHGVGPVRKYSIGAALLDKRDPSKVLARSREPLLRPEPSEREGYVPNVVYTCGAMTAQRPDHFAICGVGHFLQFRDHQDFGAYASDASLVSISTKTKRDCPSLRLPTQGDAMARETIYFVQSFNAGKGEDLKADAPIACKSATGAVRTAERLALSKLGVVAFSSTGDPEMGDYDDEPTVIFRNGQFPSAFD